MYILQMTMKMLVKATNGKMLRYPNDRLAPLPLRRALSYYFQKTIRINNEVLKARDFAKVYPNDYVLVKRCRI